MFSTAFRVFRALAVSGALLVPITAAASLQDETSEHMGRGLTLIQNGQAEAALEEFEKAIEASPELAGAHYYAGMVLGQLQRLEESLEHFVAAAELDPGNGQVHVMACRTAYSLQDYEESWNQGILAAQAGIDMSQAFAGLDQVSSRPANFDARMLAPRVFVAELDLSRVTAGDATPDRTTGSSMRLASRQADFVQTRRQLGLSLARSEHFAVVKSREQATYVLLVEVDDVLSDSALMKLIDTQTGEVVHSRPVRLPRGLNALRSATDRLVSSLAVWLQEGVKQP